MKLTISIFSLQIERELILSTDKGGSKVPIKQYPRQIPTTPVAFNRSSISNGNGSTGGVIQQFLPKSSTAVAPDHPTTKHAWVSFSSSIPEPATVLHITKQRHLNPERLEKRI